MFVPTYYIYIWVNEKLTNKNADNFQNAEKVHNYEVSTRTK